MVWVFKAHPSFEKDLKKLSKADRERLAKLIFKIKEDPTRFKPLKGFHGVFRVRFSAASDLFMLLRARLYGL